MSVTFSLARHDAAVRNADNNYVCITSAYAGRPTKLYSQTSSGLTFSRYGVFLGLDRAC